MNLLILFLIPLLGSLLLFSLKSTSGKNIATAISGAALILTAYLIFQSEGLTFSKPWIKSFNINFSLGLDGLSKVMVLITSLVSFLVILSSFTSTEKNKNNTFYALLLFAQAVLLGVFMAKDIFLFYFFFEVALIPVYFLALKWGGENAPKATFRMFLYTIFGSLFMLVAFVYLYSKGQTSDITALAQTATILPENIQRWLFWAFFIAFAIKMPVFPFHTWQPDAYTESSSSATMLLSGILSKMGVYGLLRILVPFSPLGLENYGMIAATLAIVGLIYGSIIAIQQDNMKRLVAFSSFAHMGLMAAGVFVFNETAIQGSIFQMLSHAVGAVGLFYVVDIISKKTGTLSLSSLGGISQKAPKLVTLFMVILLGSVALPLTNGFVGEFLLLKGVFDFNPILGAVAGLTIILGAVYMLRLMQKSMFGPSNETTANIEDIGTSEMLVLIPISLFVIVTGIFPNWILELTANTIAQI
ncbi:NADH dehydrogenase subunit M [Spirosomataceae bacterium TFI 002]|nr:NADH dehydrogenase subunit M [Spirosomataceae bacterium TFI 002]